MARVEGRWARYYFLIEKVCGERERGEGGSGRFFSIFTGRGGASQRSLGSRSSHGCRVRYRLTGERRAMDGEGQGPAVAGGRIPGLRCPG